MALYRKFAHQHLKPLCFQMVGYAATVTQLEHVEHKRSRRWANPGYRAHERHTEKSQLNCYLHVNANPTINYYTVF